MLVVNQGALGQGPTLSRDSVTTSAGALDSRAFATVVRQQTDFSCGAAALATVLRHTFGLDVDEPTIANQMLSRSDPERVRAQGFSMLDLKRQVDSIGLRAQGYRASIAPLETLPLPSIVLLALGAARHFVVLRRVEANRVLLADPERGERWLPRAEFEAAWVERAGLAILAPHPERIQTVAARFQYDRGEHAEVASSTVPRSEVELF